MPGVYEMKNKKLHITFYIDCDTDRLYSDDLNDTIKYLKGIKEKHPTVSLYEHWTGYEDMTMTFIGSREETDEEFNSRLKQEESDRQYKAEQLKKEKEKEARRNEYLKLKKEFNPWG
jgi:phosphohistidine phosphatase SixA